MICTRCENQETKKELTKKQKTIAIILLLFYFIPGLLYLYHLKRKINKCSKCGGSLIEKSSPKGKRILGGGYEK